MSSKPLNPVRHAKMPSDPERRAELQNHLAYVLHASKCPGLCIIPGPGCRVIKEVLAHLPDCENGLTCVQPFCATTKKLIYHYKFCLLADCPVCSAVAPTMPLSEAAKPDSEVPPTPLNEPTSTIMSDDCSSMSSASNMEAPSSASNMEAPSSASNVEAPSPASNVEAPSLASSMEASASSLAAPLPASQSPNDQVQVPVVSAGTHNTTAVQVPQVVARLPAEHITLQNELALVFHANKCLTRSVAGDLCMVPGCLTRKKVLCHMRGCMMGLRCEFPLCSRTAQLMYHFRKCVGCPMCEQLRTVITAGSQAQSQPAV